MIRLVASQWEFFKAQNGETSSLFDLASVGSRYVTFEVRCPSEVVMNLVTDDGEVLFFGAGRVVDFKGKLAGFSKIEIVSKETFAVCSDMGRGWFERVDPKPFVVVDQAPSDPVRVAIAAELRKYVGRLEAEGMLKDEVDVAELLEDIDSGDHDFDDEPEMFYSDAEEEEPEFDPDADVPRKPPTAAADAQPASKAPDAPAPGGTGIEPGKLV